MINISFIQIGVILGIVLFSILLGRWLGRKSNPKARDVDTHSPQKVKFFSSAKDRDTTIFMFFCFATVWLLARWFQEHIDVATVSLVLGESDYRDHHDGGSPVSRGKQRHTQWGKQWKRKSIGGRGFLTALYDSF